MSDSAFLTIGTPGGQWPTWLPLLLGTPAADRTDGSEAEQGEPPPLSSAEMGWDDRNGADDGDAVADADPLAQQVMGTQVLILVERPALGLAAALAAGQVDDPSQWLQEWCDGARRLLWRVQSDPMRCLLVDVEEVRQNPQALAAYVNERLGLDVAAAQTAADLTTVDALSRALAEAIAGADRNAQALFEELQASCVLLVGEAPTLDTPVIGLQIDGRSAARHLQQLRAQMRAAEDETARSAEAVAALQLQVHEQQALLQDMSKQLVRHQQLHQQVSGDFAETRRENELMLQQLHQVQEELESVSLARREAEAQLATAAAERDAQLNSAAEQREQLGRRDQALETARRDAQQAAQAAASELATAKRDLASSRQEAELLLQQLHQVQEELESTFLGRRESEARLAEVIAARDSDRQAQERRVGELQQQLAQREQEVRLQSSQLKDAQGRLSTLQAEGQRHGQQHEQAKQQYEQVLDTARRGAQQAAQAAAAELTTAQRDLASSRREAERLLLQLHKVQEELESVFLARRGAEAQLTAATAERDAEHQAHELRVAELQQQLAQREQAVEQQAGRLKDGQARLNSLQAENQRLTQQRDQALRAAQEAEAVHQAGKTAALEQAAVVNRAQLELSAQRGELSNARQENDLMLQQLHQVQEELEHYYLECRRLQEATTSSVPNNAAAVPATAEVLASSERNSTPHRELTFQLRHAVVDDLAIPETTVRLVEHHGNPGLVVFGNPQGPQLLSCWRETGREDGRPFMLLVPADAPARPLLEAMGHADWQLLLALPGWLEHALQTPDQPLGRHWQQLARRLHGQLLAQGRRFRYRQVQLLPASDGEAGVLALRFSEVNWGTHQVPGMNVRWQPDGPQAGIVLMNDTELGPPLTSWPDDEKGMPLERLHLPLGPDVPQHDKRQAWARLSALDRDFLLALLTIWPQALAQAIEGAAPGGPAVALAAEALMPDALRALRRASRWLRLPSPDVELRRA